MGLGSAFFAVVGAFESGLVDGGFGSGLLPVLGCGFVDGFDDDVAAGGIVFEAASGCVFGADGTFFDAANSIDLTLLGGAVAFGVAESALELAGFACKSEAAFFTSGFADFEASAF